MILILDEARQSPDWQIVFKPKVNAGDAGAIMGVSPYETPYGLWLLKTKRKPRQPETPAMKSGKETEPFIYEWYKQHKGIDGVSQVWAVYDEADWIAGLGDFWNAELRHGAEFKTATRADTKAHRMALEGQIPEYNWLQCIHLMEVYDAATWEYVSWHSPDNNAVIPVARDTEYWLSEMVPRYQEFFQRVLDNAWPKPEGRAPQGGVGESAQWITAAQRWTTGKAMETEAEKYISAAKAELEQLMGTFKYVSGAGVSAGWQQRAGRWEVKITAETAEAQQRVLSALEPLVGKPGIKEIKPTTTAPNLVLVVKQESKKPEVV